MLALLLTLSQLWALLLLKEFLLFDSCLFLGSLKLWPDLDPGVALPDLGVLRPDESKYTCKKVLWKSSGYKPVIFIVVWGTI